MTYVRGSPSRWGERLVFATAKALAAMFCLAANTVGHEYVEVPAAEAWELCMGTTEPHDMAISRIGVGLESRFMTVSRKPPEFARVNRISDVTAPSAVRRPASTSAYGPPDQEHSPC